MIRVHRIVIASIASLVLIPALASAQADVLGLGKNGDVQLNAVATIGATVLEPGPYRVQHVEQDGHHYLVVTTRNSRRGGLSDQPIPAGAEVARVECLFVPLARKNANTAVRLKASPDGISTIRSIWIKGEGVEHVVASHPSGEDGV